MPYASRSARERPSFSQGGSFGCAARGVSARALGASATTSGISTSCMAPVAGCRLSTWFRAHLYAASWWSAQQTTIRLLPPICLRRMMRRSPFTYADHQPALPSTLWRLCRAAAGSNCSPSTAFDTIPCSRSVRRLSCFMNDWATMSGMAQTLKIFITSSPKWLMTFTAIRPFFGRGNGRDVVWATLAHSSGSMSLLRNFLNAS